MIPHTRFSVTTTIHENIQFRIVFLFYRTIAQRRIIFSFLSVTFYNNVLYFGLYHAAASTESWQHRLPPIKVTTQQIDNYHETQSG